MKTASSKQTQGVVVDTVLWWNSLLQGVGVTNIYMVRACKLVKTKSKDCY